MELVSTFFENILVVEPERVEKAGEAPNQSEPRDEESTPQESPPQSPDQPTESESPKYSSFWYLEDDPRKAPNQLTEKLMEKVLNIVINNEHHATSGLDERLAIHRTRPPFSVNLMTTNSTHFAQKLSPVFELVDGTILFFCWYNSVYTIGVLMLITHLILNPYLGTTLPAFILLKRFIVPSYLTLYPPDPSVVNGDLWERNPIPHEGHPLRKYEPPKPCSQLSREFLMNFTDLQNHMVIYVRLYDAAVNWGQHYFLFENPNLTAVVVAFLVGLIAFNVTILPYAVPRLLPYIPWKTLAIVFVWASVGLCHPDVRDKFLDRWDTEEARVARLDATDRAEKHLMSYISDCTVTEPERTVEIFEMQRLTARKIWEPVGFTGDFYTLNNPARILDAEEQAAQVTQDQANGKSPKAKPARRWSLAEAEVAAVEEKNLHTDNDSEGSQAEGEVALEQEGTTREKEEEGPFLPIPHKLALEDIQAPAEWQFAKGAWHIDLEPHVWVNLNCIMDLVSVDTDEKWVYDFVDHGETPDAQVYRRRRWIRQCTREKISAPAMASVPNSRSSEWLSKTLSLV